jgi:hypothetical protein
MSLTHSKFILYFSDSTISKTSGDAVNAVLISGIPSTLIKEGGNSLHAELARHLQSPKIQNIWVYAEKRLAVVKVDSSESVSRILQVHASTLKCFTCTLYIYCVISIISGTGFALWSETSFEPTVHHHL